MTSVSDAEQEARITQRLATVILRSGPRARHALVCGAVIGGAFVALTAVASAQILVNLGTLPGGTFAEARAANDHGEVIGSADTATSIDAFAWTPTDGMIDLGPNTSAWAINNAGEVVGGSDTTGAGIDFHAFMWTRKRGIVHLDADANRVSFARAISDTHIVAGWAYRNDDHHRPFPIEHLFRWTASEGFVDLGTLPGMNVVEVVAVNRSGRIAGSAWFASDDPDATAPQRGFTWSATDGLVDIGTLGGPATSVAAMNDRDEIVGKSQVASGEWHAFRWTPAIGIQDLGTLDGPGGAGAIAIDATGSIVVNTAPPERAVIWTPDGAIHDLGTGNNSFAIAGNGGIVVGLTGTNQADSKQVVWMQDGRQLTLPGFGGHFVQATNVNAAAGLVTGFAGNRPGDHFPEPAVIWRLPTGEHMSTADAYVRGGRYSTSNFGAVPTLKVKKGVDRDNTRRAYLKFNVQSVTAHDRVQLRLHARLSVATLAPVTLAVYAVDDASWKEAAVTWNNRPSLNELLHTVQVTTTSADWVTVDVTRYVAAQRATGHTTISVGLRTLEHSSASVVIDSREAADFAPELLITTPR